MWNCNWFGGMPFGFGNSFMGFGPFGGILGILFFIFIIYLIIRIFRSFMPKADARDDKNDSLGILKSRLARGDIDQDEYHRMRKILSA